MKEATRNGWRKTGWFFFALVPCIAYFALNLVASMVGGIIYGLLGYIRGEEDIYTYVMDNVMIISIGFGVAALVLFGIWYYFGCKRPSPRLPKGILTVRNVTGIAIAAFGLQCVTTGITSVSGTLFPDSLNYYMELMETAGLETVAWDTILYAVILGPIAEEITFRGLTFYLARRFTSRFWLANILQALMFGIMHGNLIQGIYAFCVGLVLGWIYWNYQSIYASMLAHIVFNLLGTLVMDKVYAPLPDTTEALVEVTVLGAVVCAGAYFLMRSRNGQK